MTDEVRAEHVRLILAFREPIVARYKTIEARIVDLRQKATAGRGYSGGVWDDEDERKVQVEQARLQTAYECALQEKAQLDWMWATVKNVFGANDVELAMCDAWQTIGNLPYVKDNG